MTFEPALEDFSAFPSFRALFQPEPRHLVILHLPSTPSINPFDDVRAALAASPAPDGELLALFSARDHRCHLVAAGALLADGVNAARLTALWDALSAGTWAAPQLAATAYLLEPRFEARARATILARSAWPKVVTSLGSLYRLLPSPRLTVLSRLSDPALVAEGAGRDGLRYAVEWIDKLMRAADPSMKARWLRSPPKAAPDTAP
ncbi:MAG TPA: hypothetical protein VMZ28_00810 [Kofleriaceae bacterium]|nr:hypothetical protein [Kofleriaceae bacterium]